MAPRKMHQTTVRFGPDLWVEIELEAERAGVSVAQYVRDAALMRVAYMRGREGDAHYETALQVVADRDTPRHRLEDTAARTRSSSDNEPRAAAS